MTKNCLYCHTTFEAKRKDKLYCSVSCKRKSHSQREREKQGGRTVREPFVNRSERFDDRIESVSERYIVMLEKQLETKDEQIEHLHAMQKASAVQMANLQQQLKEANEHKAIAQGKLDKEKEEKQRRDRLHYWRKKYKASKTDKERARCEEMIRKNGG